MDYYTLSNALKQRYGEANIPSDVVSNDILELLLNHRSIRNYTSEPLPEGTLETMIAAAQSASSSSNLQAWSVVAVQEHGLKSRLARLSGNQSQIYDCPLFLVWLADLSRLERIAAAHALPHDALNYTEALVLGVVDATLAAQNAAIAAEALGLGIVYIGGVRNHPLELAQELKLPPRIFPVFGMCVGRPDPQQPASIKPRLPQAAVLHHEQYDAAQQEEAIERYNQTIGDFYREQQMRVQGDWSQHSARRVAGPQSLSGRDVLRAVLNQLGFELR